MFLKLIDDEFYLYLCFKMFTDKSYFIANILNNEFIDFVVVVSSIIMFWNSIKFYLYFILILHVRRHRLLQLIEFSYFVSGFGIRQRWSHQTEKFRQRNQQNWKQ